MLSKLKMVSLEGKFVNDRAVLRTILRDGVKQPMKQVLSICRTEQDFHIL